jgi:hypothetical protein
MEPEVSGFAAVAPPIRCPFFHKVTAEAKHDTVAVLFECDLARP